MKRLKVINLFAGPGAGKSTTAAGVFHQLKRENHSVELVTEFAKDLCWEDNPRIKDQLSVFAEQRWRLARLRGKVEWVVTDSPILLSLIYAGEDQPMAFRHLVRHEFNTFENWNFFVNRVKPYHQAGRYQDEAGARDLDMKVLDLLTAQDIFYQVVKGDEDAVETVVKALRI